MTKRKRYYGKKTKAQKLTTLGKKQEIERKAEETSSKDFLNLDFRYRDDEKVQIVSSIMKRLTSFLGREDTIYFFSTNAFNKSSRIKDIIKVVKKEGCASNSFQRSKGQHVMLRRPDGKCYDEEGVDKEDYNLMELAEFYILFTATSDDGGGMNGIEGMLIKEFAEMCGGMGTRTLLNQSYFPSGGRLKWGWVNACCMIRFRGGLEKTGLLFQPSVSARKGLETDGSTTTLSFKQSIAEGGETPRSSGAYWMTKDDDKDMDHFLKKFKQKQRRFQRLTSLQRLVYELGIMKDDALKPMQIESPPRLKKTTSVKKGSSPGSNSVTFSEFIEKVI